MPSQVAEVVKERWKNHRPSHVVLTYEQLERLLRRSSRRVNIVETPLVSATEVVSINRGRQEKQMLISTKSVVAEARVAAQQPAAASLQTKKRVAPNYHARETLNSTRIDSVNHHMSQGGQT